MNGGEGVLYTNTNYVVYQQSTQSLLTTYHATPAACAYVQVLGDDDSEGVDAATSTGGVCSRTESGTKEDEPGASTEPQLATAPAEADQDPVMKQTPELLTWLAVAQSMLDDIKKADNMKKSEWLELQTSSRSLFLQMPKVGGMRTACCCPTVAHSSSITLTLELANARSHPTPGSSYPVSRLSYLVSHSA